MSALSAGATSRQSSTAIAWNAHGELEVLTFDLGRERFAIEATLVREIVELLPETRVPGAPALVDTVVNHRGRIVPVADLRASFAMGAAPPTAESRLVVVELAMDDETLLLALCADRVHEVVTLAETSSEDAPSVGVRWPRAYVRRLVRWGNGVIVLPDLAAILVPALGGAGADA